MITPAMAATIAIRMALWPGIELAARRAQPGGSRAPITLSRMILGGHGAARLIAVSTAVAARIAATDARYGRSSPAISRPMPLAAACRSIGGLIPDAGGQGLRLPAYQSAASITGRTPARSTLARADSTQAR